MSAPRPPASQWKKVQVQLINDGFIQSDQGQLKLHLPGHVTDVHQNITFVGLCLYLWIILTTATTAHARDDVELKLL